MRERDSPGRGSDRVSLARLFKALSYPKLFAFKRIGLASALFTQLRGITR
jgi:hypothetical protein